MVVADFDGDGVDDVAFHLRADKHYAVVARGRRDGGLSDPVFLVAHEQLGPGGGIVADDLDRDGTVDLAVMAGEQLSIWRNDGAGGFLDPVRYPVPCSGLLHVGLVDADPHLDLVVGCADVPILFGLGDARFAPPRPGIPGWRPQTSALGYVDGDEHLDLVSGGDEINLYRGSATGFRANPTVLSSERASAVTIADIDRDGQRDVIAAAWSTTQAQYVRNLGGGAFDLPVQFELGLEPAAMTVGDVEGDDHLEIVAVESSGYPYTGSAISIVSTGGTGAELFDEPRLRPALEGPVAVRVTRDRHIYVAGYRVLTWISRMEQVSVRWPVHGLARGDINNDGANDLIVVHADAPRLSFVMGGYPWNGAAAPPVVAPDGWLPSTVVAGDFTGDGRTDLIAAPGPYLFEGQGLWLEPARPWAVGATGAAMQAADFDGDGNLDVAFVYAYRRLVAVAFGDGAGGVAEQRQLASDRFGDSAAVTGDLDGDGFPDLAFVSRVGIERWVTIAFGGAERVLEQRDLEVAPGYRLFVADLVEGNGRDELLILSGSTLTVVELGPDRAELVRTISMPHSYAHLEVADIDGDGRVDLLGREGSLWELLRGAGDLEFSPTGEYAFPSLESSIMDLDGDGILDMVGTEIPGGPRAGGSEAIFYASTACR